MASTPESDLDLVRAVLRGERDSRRELVRRLGCIPSMIRVRERRFCSPLSHEERQEISQDTAMALWSKLDRFHGGTPLEAWVYGFVVREHHKAVTRRARLSGQADIEDVEPVDGSTSQPSDDYPKVHASIESLGPPSDEIVRMRHFEEASFRDIAERLDMPENTVKTKYYRAVQRLRLQLRSLWMEAMG